MVENFSNYGGCICTAGLFAYFMTYFYPENPEKARYDSDSGAFSDGYTFVKVLGRLESSSSTRVPNRDSLEGKEHFWLGSSGSNLIRSHLDINFMGIYFFTLIKMTLRRDTSTVWGGLEVTMKKIDWSFSIFTPILWNSLRRIA